MTTTRVFTRPTPRTEWVRAGERCESQTGALGTVERVADSQFHTPSVRVRWDNGHTGRVTITVVRRAAR